MMISRPIPIIYSILGLLAFLWHAGNAMAQTNPTMEHPVSISLTFQKDDAEQAMELYTSLFDDARVTHVQRWGKEGPGKEGTIMMAMFELRGTRFIVSDSPPVHNWDFSPAVSVFLEFSDDEELQKILTTLAENGDVPMPLDDYGFSRKFAWVIDRFGVSWQLNLP